MDCVNWEVAIALWSVRQVTDSILCTRSSATADGPRDELCQSKSSQLLHNSTCTTSPEPIEVGPNGVRGLQSTNLKLIDTATPDTT